MATTAAIFSFLLLTKIALLLWNLFAKGRSPLADLPVGGSLLLVGTDLLMCFALMCVLFPLERWSRSRTRALLWAARISRLLILWMLVIFCVVSFQVARIYGDPLDVVLFRSADDVMVLRASLWAYLDPMPLFLLAYGFACVPLLAPPIARLIAARRWWRHPASLWLGAASVALGMTAAQRFALGGIDTFGVKNNAVVYFIQQYKPPLRPIDVAAAIVDLHARRGADFLKQQPPPSIAHPGASVARDFAAPPHAAARGFNVIVVQLESTSAMHVDRDSAPNIMALADHGLSFRRHFTSASYTARATYSLHYSDYLPELGSPPRTVYERPMAQPALAEVIRAGGYSTGFFETSFIDAFDLRFLFEQKGFDQVTAAREMIVSGGARLATASGIREDVTVDVLCDWIKSQNGRPFFATYLTESPHHPYVTHIDDNPFPTDTWLGRYKNSLHYTDAAVGQLVGFLKSSGLFDRTLIVLVGDHGETISTYPVGHGLNVSIEETQTPFIVSNPLLFPNAAESMLQTHHLDVAPTLVSVLGLQVPPEWLGRNLLDDRLPAQLHFVSLPQSEQIAVIDGGYVCVRNRSGALSLFELQDQTLKRLDPINRNGVDLRAAYGRAIDWYQDWAVLRHLERATIRP